MSGKTDHHEQAAGVLGRAWARLYGIATSHEATRDIVSTFALKGIIIVLNFLLVVLVARVLDPENFGIFSILFSAAGLLCIFATFGQQVLIIRSWNEYGAAGELGLLKGALRFSLATCLGGCALVAVGFYWWAAHSYTAVLAFAVTLYMVSKASALTSTHLVRTAIGVPAGDGYANLLTLAPALIYLVAELGLDRRAEVSTLFLLFSGGGFAAILLHFVLMSRRIRTLFPGYGAVEARYDVTAWRARSVKLWISNGLEATNQYIDVLVIGYLMSPAVAGAYFVTTRLANVFAMATESLHLVSTRHFPDYYYRGDTRQLATLLNSVAWITVAIVVGGLLTMLLGGHLFLHVFSPAYVSYYPALALLCFGTAAQAAAGPSAPILMLTGHEGRFLTIVGSTVLIRTIGFFVLIPIYGIMGAVTATALSFAFMAVMLRQSAKNLTGLDGSILRLMPGRKACAVPSPAE